MSRKRSEAVCLDSMILAAQLATVLAAGTVFAVGLIVADKSWHALKKKVGERL